MYPVHTAGQITFLIEERRREAAANQLVARNRPASAPRVQVGQALHRLASLTRLDHLRVRPARG